MTPELARRVAEAMGWVLVTDPMSAKGSPPSIWQTHIPSGSNYGPPRKLVHDPAKLLSGWPGIGLMVEWARGQGFCENHKRFQEATYWEFQDPKDYLRTGSAFGEAGEADDVACATALLAALGGER